MVARLYTMTENQCWGSVTFLYGSGYGSSDPRIHTSDKRIRILIPIRLRILRFSSLTFKMATKNYFCTKFFVITFWSYRTFTSFFKNKKSQAGTISGSVPRTYGSGFGRPKNIRILRILRIRIPNTTENCARIASNLFKKNDQLTQHIPTTQNTEKMQQIRLPETFHCRTVASLLQVRKSEDEMTARPRTASVWPFRICSHLPTTS
jgi:hypothetical protein